MSRKRHIILIPVYNDEKSLIKLLENIDDHLKIVLDFETEILVLDDRSSEEMSLKSDKFKNIKKISIIRVKENIGSQKIISVGLNYLTDIKENFFITVMDSDGEDNPQEISKMLDLALKNDDSVITSNRKSRNDPLIIKILYRIHLFITFLFSFKWITFGNFTSFNSINLKNILNDNSSWFAYSSSVIKNCKIKRIYAKRESRYFDKSKLGLLKLVEHSIRVNSVFSNRVTLISILYIGFIYIIFGLKSMTLMIISSIIFFNILIYLIKFTHSIKNLKDCLNLIDSSKIV